MEFDSVSQAYGQYFSGFAWDVYGCLTHRARVSKSHSGAMVRRFFDRLGRSIDSRVAYIAVCEHRTSGCGLPPIPTHWHLLASGPERRKRLLLSNARELWRTNGGSSLHEYDPCQEAAFYVAKLAGHQNFHLLERNLERLPYNGPKDFYEAFRASEYVPRHANLHGKTLVVR
jgi:hypothetical protein